MRSNKGLKGLSVIFHMIVLIVAVVIIILMTNTMIGSGKGQVGSIKPDPASVEGVFCNTDCTMKCGRTPMDRCDKECKYTKPGTTETKTWKCSDIEYKYGDTGDTPAGPAVSVSGDFAPCGKMTITYAKPTNAVKDITFRICENANSDPPTGCIKIYDDAGTTELTKTSDGKNYKLCTGAGCTPADSKVEAKFKLTCTVSNTDAGAIKEKKLYSLVVEPNGAYAKKTVTGLSWSCPTVSFPDDIEPGYDYMPVEFTGKNGDMTADLHILKGTCVESSGASHPFPCTISNALTYNPTGENYTIKMPWVDPKSTDNSIIFENLKIGGSLISGCRPASRFTWSCPELQCTKETVAFVITKEYKYTEYSQTGTYTGSPFCKYNKKTECDPSCFLDPNAEPKLYSPGNCKDTETKLELGDGGIYTLTKYVYKCSGKGTEYVPDPHGKQACKFRADGSLKDDGLIDYYKRIFLTCGTGSDATKLFKGTTECRCDDSGKPSAAPIPAATYQKCIYPVCNGTGINYNYNPKEGDVCKCDDQGKLSGAGTKNCSTYAAGDYTLYASTEPLYIYTEIKNTGPVDVLVDASKMTVIFGGTTVNPSTGMFTELLKPDRTIDTDYPLNNVKYPDPAKFKLLPAWTVIYWIPVSINNGGTKTVSYPIQISFKYGDKTLEGDTDITVHANCCNGCTCSSDSACNDCGDLCEVDVYGVCNFK